MALSLSERHRVTTCVEILRGVHRWRFMCQKVRERKHALDFKEALKDEQAE